MRRITLGRFFPILALLRNLASKLAHGTAQWSHRTSWTAPAIKSWKEAWAAIEANEPIPYVQSEVTSITTWSDASMQGWCIILQDQAGNFPVWRQGKWSASQGKQHINVLEAWAAQRAAEAAAAFLGDLTETLEMRVDNSAVKGALAKGHSANYLMNEAVSVVRNLFPRVNVTWVPSAKMLADYGSRNF